MPGQSGFFDVDERLKGLSDLGDQLLAFAAAVDFEMFRAELTRALAYSDGSQRGRPPFDPVLMFKVRVVQATNNLSDERAEFLINDRLSFMRFLDLGLADRVPDARTIWLFREKLTHAGAIKPLFDRFNAALREVGYIAMGGQIIDATLIAAPKQRNTEEAWIPERSATRLREADLNVLSKLGNQGLEWRLEPEAFTGVRLVVRTISWMSWSDVRSISRWRGSHRRKRPLAFSIPPFLP
jgi:transposase